MHGDKLDRLKLCNIKLKTSLQSFKNIIIIIRSLQYEGIVHFAISDFFSFHALDAQSCIIKYFGNFHKESTSITEDTFNHKTDTSFEFFSEPMTWDATFESNLFDIWTIEGMDCHDSLTDYSNNLFCF